MVEYNPELQKTLKRVSEGKDIGLGALMQNLRKGWKSILKRIGKIIWSVFQS